MKIPSSTELFERRAMGSEGTAAYGTPMSIAKRHRLAGPLAAWVAGLWLAVPHVAAGQAAAPIAEGKAPARPGYATAFPMYRYPGPCWASGPCVGMGWWGERWPLRRPVAPEPAEPAEQDLWGTTGSPWGYVRRLPPPTPESQILPRYRGASTIRPEFDERSDGKVPN